MKPKRPTYFAGICALLFGLAFLWSGRIDRPVAARPTISNPSPALPEFTVVEPQLAAIRDGVSASASRATVAEITTRLAKLLIRNDAREHEAVLTFADQDSYRLFLERAQHHGISVLGQLDALLTVRVRYDSLQSIANDFSKYGGGYTHIGANYFVDVPQRPARELRAIGTPQPFRNSALEFLGITNEHASWGRGVRIAILDSGVAQDLTFNGGRVQYLDVGLGTLPGYQASDGHGTSVAALAAGSAADAPGVSPAATVLSIRVTDASGRSDIFTVASAILAATNAGAPIINLSLGGYATTPALTAAIDYAIAKGAVIVAAAGNDQAAQLTWPAADPRVISVGAVDARSQQVAFSNSGPQLQIAAPGYGVQSAWLNGQRVYVDGTSASAPLVAGAIAAVMSQNPGLSAPNAWSIIQRTASDAGLPGADPSYGAGVLNLDWAMNYNQPARHDPAMSSHHYDAALGTMNFVVQNRSAQPARNLAMEVVANGVTSTHRVPEIGAGSTYVLTIPVERNESRGSNGVTFSTRLVTPFGMEDANTTNNALTSFLPNRIGAGLGD